MASNLQSNNSVPNFMALSPSSEVLRSTESYTQIEVINTGYIWKMKTPVFSQNQKVMKSDTFITKDESKWCLAIESISQLVRRGDLRTAGDTISLYAILVSCKTLVVNAKLKFSIINAKRETYLDNNITKETNYHQFTTVSSPVFGTNQPSPFSSIDPGNKYGCDMSIRTCDLFDLTKGFVQNGTLTILCEISIMTGSKNIAGPNNTQIEELKCQLLDNLGLLLENKKFCDITITVSGKEFQVHKAILAAQSRVFSAMFEHDMKEKRTNNTDITDVDPEVFREMLQFIYSGKTKNLNEIANDMLAAAEKYELEKLKEICQETLGKNLTIENAADILILADRYNAGHLKATAINFINTHEVMNTPGFKSMLESYPRLVTEAYLAMRSYKPTDRTSSTK